MKIIKLIGTWALLIFIQLGAHAQSLPVGTPVLEDYYRRLQLLGITDTNVSFTVRPIFPGIINSKANAFYPDSTEQRYNLLNATGVWQSKDKKLNVSMLPLSLQTEF